MRAGLGGFAGRALQAGDRLPLKNAAAEEGDEHELADSFDYGSGPVRVVLGPQEDRFTAAGTATFLSETYTVTKEADRSEEHTSELQSLMRISYAVFCLKKKKH